MLAKNYHEWLEQQERSRGQCLVCLRTPLTCYCKHVQSFDPKVRFAILIHKREAQKSIATGRMAHLCLKGSLLIRAYDDYSDNEQVNAILANPAYYPVILYPGPKSTNISSQTLAERTSLFPADKELVIFVIDGTWSTAKRTLLKSKNLRQLPQICFSPTQPSRFRVRKQPNENFYSTIEAIHQTIELLGSTRGFDASTRQHDQLLHVFEKMVDQQIELAQQPKLFCQWSPKKNAKLLSRSQ